MKGDTYLQFEIKPDNMLLFILKKKDQSQQLESSNFTIN